MSKNLEEIVDTLKNQIATLLEKTPLSKRAINHALENAYQIKLINKAVEELMQDKRITFDAQTGAFALAAQKASAYRNGESVWCRVQIGRSKNGQEVAYAIPENGGSDIKISSGDEGLAFKQDYLLSGDRVCVKVTDCAGKKPFGVVVKLDATKRPQYVHGTVAASSNGAAKWLVPFGGLNFECNLDASCPLNAGDLAKVKIVSYPTISEPYLYGESAKQFGDANNPDSFEQCFMSLYGLDPEFPSDVLAEVKQFADPTEDEVQKLVAEEGFVDLRGLLSTTTDPDTAKDFDDASSIEKLKDKDGKTVYVLYQHIANVGHYIKPSSPTFEEGRRRGTSTYLARTVVPMLPKVLSNGVCSLNPDVDRLALTTIILFNEKGERIPEAELASGKILKCKMVKSVIHSAKRMTYSQNQEVISGHDVHLTDDLKLSKRIQEKIALETELSRLIDKQRRKRDALNFARPDKMPIFSPETGKLVEIKKEGEEESHRVVENFALSTNEYHAFIMNLFNDMRGEGEEEAELTIPYVHRFHESPSEEKVEQAKSRLDELGAEIAHLPDELCPLFLDRLLAQTDDDNVKDFMQVLVLRALPRATYQIDQTGHFGLQLENYAQVTSPIRRIGDTFNQIVDTLLIDMDIRTSFGKLTLDKAVAYMEKTKYKTSAEVLEKRAKIKAEIKKYLTEQFRSRFKINDVFEYAANLARVATETERNAEKAENEMLERWCAFTMEDAINLKGADGRAKYYNARFVSINGDRVEIEILDKPFTNFVGTLITNGKEYKFDLKDKTKNIIKVKIVQADKFNRIITFEEDERSQELRPTAMKMERGEALTLPAGKSGKKNGKKNGNYFD